jgi:hypothetical protein
LRVELLGSLKIVDGVFRAPVLEVLNSSIQRSPRLPLLFGLRRGFLGRDYYEL